MKKGYECKPHIIASLVFHATLMFGYMLLRSALQSLSQFQLSGGIGGALVGAIIFISGVVGIIAVCVEGYLYYLKKEKSIAILTGAIANTVIVVFVIMLMSSISAGMLTFVFVLSLITFLYELLVLLALLGVVKITGTEAYLPKLQGITHEEEVEQEQSQPKVTGVEVKKFFRNKITIGVIGAIVVILLAFGVYKYWDANFNFTTFDAYKGVSVVFSGSDGEGYGSVQRDTEGFSEEEKAFARYVNVSLEQTENLSNGQQVKVVVQYSKEDAKRLKFKVKEETKEFDVSGLTIVYKSASDVDKSVYNKAKAAAEKKSAESSYDETYLASYLAIPDATKETVLNKNTYIVFVYKMKYTSFFSKESKDYYIIYYTNFDSSFDEEHAYLYMNYLNDEKGNDIKDDKKVADALAADYKFKDLYKLEEIK